MIFRLNYDDEFEQPYSIEATIKQWAFDVGRDRPDVAWLLSPYDTWETNPFYKGEPQPNPEAYQDLYYGDFSG
jgi:hypothetical protein